MLCCQKGKAPNLSLKDAAKSLAQFYRQSVKTLTQQKKQTELALAKYTFLHITIAIMDVT